MRPDDERAGSQNFDPAPAFSFNRLLRMAEIAFAAIAATMLLMIMLIGSLDVALRYLFNSPLGWSYDVISMYLMAGLFFFSLSDTLERNGHVAVDLLHSRMSPRARHLAAVPGYATVAVVLAAICWLTTGLTVESYRGGDFIAGRFNWPTWIGHLFIAIGFTLILLRVLYRLVGHTRSALTGRSVIGLPPVAGRET